MSIRKVGQNFFHGQMKQWYSCVWGTKVGPGKYKMNKMLFFFSFHSLFEAAGIIALKTVLRKWREPDLKKNCNRMSVKLTFSSFSSFFISQLSAAAQLEAKPHNMHTDVYSIQKYILLICSIFATVLSVLGAVLISWFKWKSINPTKPLNFHFQVFYNQTSAEENYRHLNIYHSASFVLPEKARN